MAIRAGLASVAAGRYSGERRLSQKYGLPVSRRRQSVVPSLAALLRETGRFVKQEQDRLKEYER